MFKRIIFFILAIAIFSCSVAFAADPTLVTRLNKGLDKIKGWILKLSTPAAAIAVGTGVFMKKFSFGDEERIVMRKKTYKKFSVFLCIYFINRFNSYSNNVFSKRKVKGTIWKKKYQFKQ